MEPGQQDESADVRGFDFAAVGARLGARLIDSLIGVAVYIAAFITVIQAYDIQLDVDGDIDVPGGAAFILRFLPVVLWGLYEVLLIRTRGQTVGKQIMKIKVISTGGDDPPLWNAALFRWAVLALPMTLIPDAIGLIVSLIIGIWFLWDRNRQGLHDKAASTYVVKVTSRFV